jgi:hypothetical protein
VVPLPALTEVAPEAWLMAIENSKFTPGRQTFGRPRLRDPLLRKSFPART